MRTYGTVIGCLLIAVITVSAIPMFSKKNAMNPLPESTPVTDFEMRLQSVADKKNPSETISNSGENDSDLLYYTLSPGLEVSRYSFVSDGDFSCMTSENGYEAIDREIYQIIAINIPATEDEIFEIDMHSYFVRWHNRDGYYALYGENTTKDNFTDVYRKLTQD